jgi:hypothetical protein
MVLQSFGRITNLQIFKTVICLNGTDIWSTGRIPLIKERQFVPSKRKNTGDERDKKRSLKREISLAFIARLHCVLIAQESQQ